MAKSHKIRTVNVGEIDVKRSLRDITNKELLFLADMIAMKDVGKILGCSSQNISMRLKRARDAGEEEASPDQKSERVVSVLQDIATQNRTLMQGLPKESKDTVGALLGACVDILDDLVKDPDLSKKMYLEVAKVIMQLAKTKTEIFEHYRRVVGVREFRRIIIETIRKFDQKAADKIILELQNDERLRWML